MIETKNIGIVGANNLAEYIISKYGPMSHLKLQKLLYYCQAYHLAYFETPLFNEDFQAWVHGPVCVEVYDEIKGITGMYNDISYKGDVKEVELKVIPYLITDQQNLLNDVLANLSTWTGLELEAATHKETPWIYARKGYGPADICNVIITKESMMMYYKSEINAAK